MATPAAYPSPSDLYKKHNCSWRYDEIRHVPQKSGTARRKIWAGPRPEYCASVTSRPNRGIPQSTSSVPYATRNAPASGRHTKLEWRNRQLEVSWKLQTTQKMRAHHRRCGAPYMETSKCYWWKQSSRWLWAYSPDGASTSRARRLLGALRAAASVRSASNDRDDSGPAQCPLPEREYSSEGPEEADRKPYRIWV